MLSSPLSPIPDEFSIDESTAYFGCQKYECDLTHAWFGDVHVLTYLDIRVLCT